MAKKIIIRKNIEDGVSNKKKLKKNIKTQENFASFGSEDFQKKNTNQLETEGWWNEDWGDEEDLGL